MAEQKKYLDGPGVTYLWEKILGEIEPIQAAVEDASSKQESLDELIGSIPADSTAKNIIEYAQEIANKATGDASQVASDLATESSRAEAAEKDLGDNITALKNLHANADEGEGKKTVAQEVAAGIASVVASAPTEFDTLKEIADWIANDKTGAAAMQNAIATLTGDENTDGSILKALADAKNYSDEAIKDLGFDDLTEILGAPVEGEESKTLADVIKELQDAIGEDGSVSDQISAIQGNTTETIESIDAKIEAINNAETGLLKQAQNYADGLSSNYATSAQGEKADSALQPNDVIALTSDDIDTAIANAIKVNQ